MLTRASLRLLLSLPLILPGCTSKQSPDSGHRFVVTLKNGIETAVISGGPKFTGGGGTLPVRARAYSPGR